MKCYLTETPLLKTRKLHCFEDLKMLYVMVLQYSVDFLNNKSLGNLKLIINKHISSKRDIFSQALTLNIFFLMKL